RESDMTNNMAYTRGVTDNLRYSWNRIEAINAMVTDDLTADDTDRYTYYFDIFKYHSNWKTLFLPSQLRTALYAWPDAQKGYESTDEVGPCELSDWSEVTERTAIPEIQEEHLDELMAYLKEQGQEALFIVSPYLHTREQAQMFNYIGDKVEAQGFGFLNLNDYYEEIGIDAGRDFNDYGNHTNASGAQKVTAFFERYLKENYEFPDRRGDVRYESWDEAYALWQDNYAAAMEKIEERIETGDYAEKAE
ncbi:MAG: SGNH/GDSL hydrolase family protein, partial [Eubacteriales bacterium]|nr:SGNH/GDSL hydrolase family protein [Eubacteriales bacterium]